MLDYAGGGTSKYVEGEQVSLHHLTYCAITKICDEYIELLGLSLQTSNLTASQPHEINCFIYANKKPKIKCKCSCKAGELGVCKHCMGLLLYLVR